MKRRQDAATPGSRGKVEPREGSEDTERTILDLAPDQEVLDWICYLVRGGIAPEADPAARKLEAKDRLRRRPEREDIERALGDLVSHGMLTCDDGRWSMTPKGHGRSRELCGPRRGPAPMTAQPGEPGADQK
jgi:hypothetical protein